MTTRSPAQPAALPVQCTRGFKSLRDHVKQAKGKQPPVVSPPIHEPSDDREQEWEEEEESQPQLEPLACNNEEHVRRVNHERLQQEEHQLNAIRLQLAKEHRELKTRERAAKSMESALQDAMERTAEKETRLDQRIQEIARLEQRLHDAVTQHTSSSTPVDPEIHASNDDTNHSIHEHENAIRKLEEREAILQLREQELALARDQVSHRERHLTTKERVLRDKAAELSQFQIELETKATQRAATVEERLVQQEQELQQRYMALEQELTDRFQSQLRELNTEFETKRALHEERNHIELEKINTQELDLVGRKEAATGTATGDGTPEGDSEYGDRGHAESPAESRMQAHELMRRLQEAEDSKQRYDQAHERVGMQERTLALFAAEVETQHKANTLERERLDQERAAAETSTQSNGKQTEQDSVDNGINTSALIPEPAKQPPPAAAAARRSLTSALFRSKSVNRS